MAVSVPWNTTGFGSDASVPVKVVVNPYGRLNETNIANNSKSVNITVTPDQVAQTITFAALPDKMLPDPDFALVASAAPSGLPVSFSSMTPSVCAVSGNMVRLVTTGTCTIEATQAGNAFFLAAPRVTQSFAVKSSNKLDQTITFNALVDKTLGDPAFALNATGESGLPVSFSAQTPGVCTINGNTVTLVATGACSIQATQNGDNTYNPATPVTQGFTVQPGKMDQTITFGELSGVTLANASFLLNASATSGSAVDFSSLTPTICQVDANTVTLLAVGICTLRCGTTW